MVGKKRGRAVKRKQNDTDGKDEPSNKKLKVNRKAVISAKNKANFDTDSNESLVKVCNTVPIPETNKINNDSLVMSTSCQTVTPPRSDYRSMYEGPLVISSEVSARASELVTSILQEVFFSDDSCDGASNLNSSKIETNSECTSERPIEQECEKEINCIHDDIKKMHADNQCSTPAVLSNTKMKKSLPVDKGVCDIACDSKKLFGDNFCNQEDHVDGFVPNDPAMHGISNIQKSFSIKKKSNPGVASCDNISKISQFSNTVSNCVQIQNSEDLDSKQNRVKDVCKSNNSLLSCSNSMGINSCMSYSSIQILSNNDSSELALALSSSSVESERKVSTSNLKSNSQSVSLQMTSEKNIGKQNKESLCNNKDDVVIASTDDAKKEANLLLNLDCTHADVSSKHTGPSDETTLSSTDNIFNKKTKPNSERLDIPAKNIQPINKRARKKGLTVPIKNTIEESNQGNTKDAQKLRGRTRNNIKKRSGEHNTNVATQNKINGCNNYEIAQHTSQKVRGNKKEVVTPQANNVMANNDGDDEVLKDCCFVDSKQNENMNIGKRKKKAVMRAAPANQRTAAKASSLVIEDNAAKKKIKVEPKAEKSTSKKKSDACPALTPPSTYPSLGAGPTPLPNTGKKYMGAHISGAGGIYNVFANARAINAKSFAMFLRSQRQWAAKPWEDSVVKKYHEEAKDFAPHLILPHGSYLMNIGSNKPDLLEKSRALLEEELDRCLKLGIPHFNFHPGSCVGGSSREDCCKTIAESINIVHAKVPTVIVVLENMCKQGNTIGGDFHELRLIIEHVKDRSRVGVCLDTCHAHNAGYDLSTEEGFNTMIEDFRKIIGFQFLRGLHINDSKNEAGAHVDRHENIGKGFIGKEGMKRIMNCELFNDMPLILETPYVTDAGYAKEIQMLEEMIDGSKEDKSKKNTVKKNKKMSP